MSLELTPSYIPVYTHSSQVPMRGANVWPGFVTKATMPNSSAEAACCRWFNTKSSSTRSVITKFNSLQVPSVNTRLLQRIFIKFCKEFRKHNQAFCKINKQENSIHSNILVSYKYCLISFQHDNSKWLRNT